jgi:DNA polymerase-3 subunit beta
VTLSKGGPAAFTKDIIVPSKTLNQLLRLFGEEETDIEVSVTENQMIFTLDGTTLYSRLIEGPYPDYTQVIPADSDKKLIVDREVLHAAMRRVSTLSNALTHQVKFDLSKKGVLLSASDRDVGGEAQVELKAEYSGDDLQIGYNAYYIMEILRHLESDQVVFDLSTPVRAGLIMPAPQNENEEYLCLIMPLRLTEETTE